MPKKLVEVSMDELIVAALEEARNYPLMLDNDQLAVLFKNKFVTDEGVQIPPKELVAKLVEYIEDNPPQTTDQFAKFVGETLSAMSAQVVSEKKKK
jgi:hypothetical protein